MRTPSGTLRRRSAGTLERPGEGGRARANTTFCHFPLAAHCACEIVPNWISMISPLTVDRKVISGDCGHFSGFTEVGFGLEQCGFVKRFLLLQREAAEIQILFEGYLLFLKFCPAQAFHCLKETQERAFRRAEI